MICKGLWKTVCELEEEERKVLAKEIAESLGVDEEKVLLVMTRDEYRDWLYDTICKEYNIPDEIAYYLDIDKMIDDQISDGIIVSFKTELTDQMGIKRKIEIIAEINW